MVETAGKPVSKNTLPQPLIEVTQRVLTSQDDLQWLVSDTTIREQVKTLCQAIDFQSHDVNFDDIFVLALFAQLYLTLLPAGDPDQQKFMQFRESAKRAYENDYQPDKQSSFALFESMEFASRAVNSMIQRAKNQRKTEYKQIELTANSLANIVLKQTLRNMAEWEEYSSPGLFVRYFVGGQSGKPGVFVSRADDAIAQKEFSTKVTSL